MEVDLLLPEFNLQKNAHKLNRIVQAPNSYFMDVKCPGCSTLTTIFSHA